MNRLQIRAYDTDRLVLVAAPMPGLEPADIVIEVRSDTLIIRGRERGNYRNERRPWIDEWRVGGYQRELRLPHSVEVTLANVTYGNGVLVVALPKAAKPSVEQRAEIRLSSLPDPIRGEHVGYVGRAMAPATTEAHLRKHLSR
jgi:HSP20 family protein